MPGTTIEPTAEQIRELAASDTPGPIVMLNLLRFRERASGIHADSEISGRAAYERYGEGVAKHLAAVGGRVLHLAQGDQTVIGPAGESWDLVILVQYPSRHAFLQMVADPDYQQVHEHRAAAISDSRLICCTAPAG